MIFPPHVIGWCQPITNGENPMSITPQGVADALILDEETLSDADRERVEGLVEVVAVLLAELGKQSKDLSRSDIARRQDQRRLEQLFGVLLTLAKRLLQLSNENKASDWEGLVKEAAKASAKGMKR